MTRLPSEALSKCAVLLACTLFWSSVTPVMGQGTYSWNITSGTWNTTDASWAGAGSTWVNGTSSNGVFNNTSGATVTISGSVSARDVSFGGASSNLSWTLSGGTLSAAGNFVYQGQSTNSGNYAANPTLSVNSSVSVAGSTLVGRATLSISGGTFTTNRITSNPTSPDWGYFQMYGGSVTATNGVDGTYGTSGSNGTSSTFAVLLQGGTLSTSYLKVASRQQGTNNNAFLTLNGGVLRALSSTSSFIQTYGGSNVFIAASGANFDSNGFDITVDRTLVNFTGQVGFVRKQGSGTLTLSGVNSYTGVTNFSGGTLNATSITNYGVAGSLGNRASDSSSGVGLFFRGGTLQYTGSTAQSTDRAIRLSTTGGGGTIDASGSVTEATLTFSATSSPNFFEFVGSRSLTLTGSNAGNNTFAMAIGEAGGATSVVKSGNGTWVLSGNSSYTGGTQINGGVLSLGHASALGDSGTITFGGGVLRFSSSNTTDYSNRFSTAANQAYAIDTNGQTVSFAAGLTSSGGSLTKLGTGLLVLSASSSYNGGTSITTGTLRAANARAFGTGTITLASSATLDVNNLAVANTITSNGGTILNAASFTGTTALSSGTTVLQSIGGAVDIGASAVAELSGTINADVMVKAGGRGRALGQIQKNVTVSGGGQFDILNDATIDEAASFSFANNGQIHIDRTNNINLSKVISGTGGLRKSGNSRVTLTGANTFTGLTQIDAGTLVVNGALAGDVTVALGATLGGSGVLGDMLSGAGTISVGNSPGIGTAASVDPSAGTDWVFEITGTAPAWNAGASASVNDVLRLTDATPFASSLASGNVVDVLFNLTSGGPVGQGDYLGGFFVDNESFNLAAALADGTFRYWVAGEYGTTGQRQSFNVGEGGSAVTYSLLAAYDPSLSASYMVTQQTVNFGSGDVTGSVTQFVIVPEPTTLVIATIGIAMAGWLRGKRYRITYILQK